MYPTKKTWIRIMLVANTRNLSFTCLVHGHLGVNCTQKQVYGHMHKHMHQFLISSFTANYETKHKNYRPPKKAMGTKRSKWRGT